MMCRWLTAAILFAAGSSALPADDLPDREKLENDGAVIGEIVLDRADVFDLGNPDENKALFRVANRLHIITRDGTIRKQLLIASGEPYSKQLVEETERLLRNNRYLYDAEIEAVRYEQGVVDLEVRTRDLWSIGPEFSISRSGGKTRNRIGLEETNLLGRGQTLRFLRDDDVDRTEKLFEFRDQHLGRSWVSLQLGHSDNSDGRVDHAFVERPFYALDTRWSAGVRAIDGERREAFYALGDEAAEYHQESRYYAAWGGWSRGLRNNWARRWTAGVVNDEARHSIAANPILPELAPADRKLVYGFIGLELVENQFETARNRDQISKTEDFQMGSRITASLGWSDTALGADRDALVYQAAASRGFGTLEQTALLTSASLSGRREGGRSADLRFNFSSRFYHTQSSKRVFFAALSGSAGHALDIDNLVDIGGDNGLRGYPLRYQNGESKILATIEQRYYTDWYPFRLFRVGGAIFADVGRVWGTSPVGEQRLGWLRDIGFGFRLSLTRSSPKVVHIDVAFPLDGEDSLDSVQFLIEGKRSF